jgi:flavin reductase (DIM6/NTAB) family NADH-FMN oxidoreductase RutF
VTAQSVREAFRNHPEGITIITTLDEFGNSWGMTATAVSSASLDPPLLLVSLTNRSPLLGPLTARAHFVVHFLAENQADLARRFASPVEDKFDGARYRFAWSGCATLDGVCAALECVTEAVHLAGDHKIVLGRIVDITVNESAPGALVYFNGEMRAISAASGSAAG